VKPVIAALIAVLSIAVPAALAWPGPPKSPPPAWIETEMKSSWLFYGSYCWKTGCVDMIPPQTRPGLPVFTVVRGARVRVHVAFAAKRVSVSVDRHSVRARLDATRRVVSWSATRVGILTVSVQAAVGGASYVARLQVR
jgi:hypothetical protein